MELRNLREGATTEVYGYKVEVLRQVEGKTYITINGMVHVIREDEFRMWDDILGS